MGVKYGSNLDSELQLAADDLLCGCSGLPDDRFCCRYFIEWRTSFEFRVSSFTFFVHLQTVGLLAETSAASGIVRNH
jgi:hypothetical protein